MKYDTYIKNFFCFSLLPSPSEYDMNLCVAFAMAAFKKPNMAMEPPIRLKIPKSEGPNEFNISRVVYSEMNIVMPIFIYKKLVFLIIRLAVDDMCLILEFI